MATTLTPGTRRRASTWAAPMNPEPMTATLTGGICARRRVGRYRPAALRPEVRSAAGRSDQGIWNRGTPTGGAKRRREERSKDLEPRHSDRRCEAPQGGAIKRNLGA